MNSVKTEIRAQIKKQLLSLSEEEHITYSTTIAEKLYKQPEWKEAKTIAITISVDHEVDTYSIIQQAWVEGKRIMVPKCIRETRAMSFREINDFEQLETVYMNLKEPIIEQTKIVNKEQVDLIICPGLAFTAAGDRLGYGGGYYDRYLENYKGNVIALAFEFQMVSSLPIEEFDQKVRKIITNRQVYDCLNNIFKSGQ
ncbi:5-formyltetrahydrofolate cyclo-ligase [Bacillus sp. 165]|uniref:5-formyltetrahydrofolate cyclo-ligase n=1 Tax=Bacillus sp. 165 TaxID=1529117 RepID=UPI0032AF8660